MTLNAQALSRPLERLLDDGADVHILAALSRWPAERTLAIEGRCRGALLADWADNLHDRWGARAAVIVREGLRAEGQLLPDAPRPVAWYPVGVQLRMMEIVLDEVVDGDVDALRDALSGLVKEHRAACFLARRFGIDRVLVRAAGLYSQCYDVGRAETRVRGQHATVTSMGAPLVLHPTWQLLQLLAHEVLADVAGHRHARVRGHMGPGQIFEARIDWR